MFFRTSPFTHPGLCVCEPPGVLQLRAEAGLVLAQLRGRPLGLLRVVRQVAVLHRQLTAEFKETNLTTVHTAYSVCGGTTKKLTLYSLQTWDGTQEIERN